MKRIHLVCTNYEEQNILIHAFKQHNLQVLIKVSVEQLVQTWGNESGEIIIFATENHNITNQFTLLSQTVSVPIIILSDPIGETMHINWLKHGATCIFMRPYSTRLLVHQIRALLNYTTGIFVHTLEHIQIGNLILHPDNRTVQLGEQSLYHLTNREFRLLYKFFTNSHRLLTFDQLRTYAVERNLSSVTLKI